MKFNYKIPSHSIIAIPDITNSTFSKHFQTYGLKIKKPMKNCCIIEQVCTLSPEMSVKTD